jgi:hypothetical protein
MSSFAWLDSSEHEQRRALDVIDLLQQKETVDELGLGSVRDTIADVLAPGTSTVQTRARYFFFIPWIYQTVSTRLGRTAKEIGQEARGWETSLIERLAASDDAEGTIGVQSKKDLQRLPSAIYWAGLGVLGFRLYPGSRDQYHKALSRRTERETKDEAQDIVIGAPIRGDWHPHIPNPPKRFPDDASFRLRRSEARFFAGQLEMHARGSLLHFLVANKVDTSGAAFGWELPCVRDMSEDLQRWLHDAQCYSELMQGAQLLYGLMLAEQKESDDLVEQFRASVQAWAELIEGRQKAYAAWDRASFWLRVRGRNSRLPAGVQHFSQEWMGGVLEAVNPAVLFDDARSRELVMRREEGLKRGRARLKSRAHLDLWGGRELRQLTYRWDIAATVARDICIGLESADADA